VLAAAGASLDDVIDVTTFLTDPEAQFATIMAVKGRICPAASYPTWTPVRVNWLAGFDFEIKEIARLSESP
jgi:enamine deaminase RidA (YjgF/YER057c/UK114 family)